MAKKKEISGSPAFTKSFKKAMDQVWGKKRNNPSPFKKK
tara:strand:+ start:775 stop:891 length:117 start_codon:yes stop_codon:yes gene_type:complete